MKLPVSATFEILLRIPMTTFGPGTYRQSHVKKLQVTEYRLRILEYIMPTDKLSVNHKFGTWTCMRRIYYVDSNGKLLG